MSRRYVPALRGRFGDWTYYCGLMTLSELCERVQFAKDLHTSEKLSQLIQRELKGNRARDISEYLKTDSERFFNSLVVAVYGGDPAWHEFGDFRPQRPDINIEEVSSDVKASVGFLSFTGEEKLFALDGQHRLAGIQLALKDASSLSDDEVSVIFVPHKKRELFTLVP